MFPSHGNIHLEWLSHSNDRVHVVAIETQDEVSGALGQFLLSKGYLEERKSEIVNTHYWTF